MSITLIGMPSCGKSTLGVILAKRLGYRFIDTDLLIQESQDMLLHDIIALRGNQAFLSIENDILCSVTDTRAVISTGGSAVYSEQAMRHLASLGKIVYLKIDLKTMLSRLGDYSHRGVVMPHGYTLEDMYAQRAALYESFADVTVEVDSFDISANVDKICSAQ